MVFSAVARTFSPTGRCVLSLIALLSLVACDFEPTETFVPDIESTSTDLSIGATTVEVTPGSVIKLTTGDAVMLTLSAGGNVGDGGSVGDEGVGSVIPVHIEA